ncbi:zinc abc transporter, periplasmic-binding protein znua [hydrocarbon metagenome]|uniref:Zinc abc transporter, periplasmic-binding protein znua n=1 Tax=hydrocarbon metagenome TaxID=938273 RepID=A0A0W8E3Z3_9ZZZZ
MNKYFSIIIIVTLGLCLLLLGGCSADQKPAVTGNKAAKTIIAVSIIPEQTFVEAVAGDMVEVVVMVPPGSNPENYSPTPQEMAKLSDASLYFAIGVPAERANILPSIKDLNSRIKVVDLPAAAAAVYPDREFAPGERDPHIWLSPKRVRVIVDTIADELGQLDPVNAEYYLRNAQNYQKQLEKLDTNIKSALADLDQKTFIVYHPALGYFAEDYDLQMLAIEEEGKEATAKHIQEIIDQAKNDDIQVVFYQASVSSKQAAAIAQDIGGYTEKIDPLAADYTGNLQKIADTFARVLQQKR